MTSYAALDVSMEKTAICVIDADGKIVLEAVTISDPEAIARCLAPHRAELELVGFEAGPLSEWLFRGLQEQGIQAVLMETRQVRAAMPAMVMKTDRNDARGMAQLLRSGWFRPVHVKTIPAREQRTLLAARTTLMRRQKDIENSVRGLLKGFGLRLGRLLRGRWTTPSATSSPATRCSPPPWSPTCCTPSTVRAAGSGGQAGPRHRSQRCRMSQTDDRARRRARLSRSPSVPRSMIRPASGRPNPSAPASD